MTFARAWLLIAAVGCGGGGGFPDAAPIDDPPPGGTFTLDWAVTDTGGAPITCDDIGALSVTMILRNHDVAGGSTEVFTCGTLMGTTPAQRPGTYDVMFELNGVTGLIATAPAQLNIGLASGMNIHLPAIAFPVNATGGMKLHVLTHATGGNCASGAGITQTTITLKKVSTGACAPVTLAIAAGANGTASNYTVDCTTPTVGPCIDEDQEISVTGVPSGTYQMQIRGKAGANCWKNDDQIPVPPLGGDLVRDLNLALQMAAPSC